MLLGVLSSFRAVLLLCATFLNRTGEETILLLSFTTGGLSFLLATLFLHSAVFDKMKIPLNDLNTVGAADVYRYDPSTNAIVEVLKHNRSQNFVNQSMLIGSVLTLGRLKKGKIEEFFLKWIFDLMKTCFKLK
uniref:Uncharacterized protein n=1 Tax=Anopheles farauti TaxID=69004 RepID=A0A182QKQ6_9DIPT